MTMTKASFFVLLAGISGCGAGAHPPASQPNATTTPQAALAPSSGEHFDFEAVLRREIEPLPVQKFSQDVVSGQVEALGPPAVERTKESIKIVIPIGTKAPIECYVYNERTDGASTIGQVVAEVKKSIDVRLFEPTDVFAAAGHAALAAHAIYIVKGPKGD